MAPRPRSATPSLADERAGPVRAGADRRFPGPWRRRRPRRWRHQVPSACLGRAAQVHPGVGQADDRQPMDRRPRPGIDRAMTDDVLSANVRLVDAPDDVEPVVLLQGVGQGEAVKERRSDVREGRAVGQGADQCLGSLDEIRGWGEASNSTEGSVQALGGELSFGEAERSAVGDGERRRGECQDHASTVPRPTSVTGRPESSCGRTRPRPRGCGQRPSGSGHSTGWVGALSGSGHSTRRAARPPGRPGALSGSGHSTGGVLRGLGFALREGGENGWGAVGART